MARRWRLACLILPSLRLWGEPVLAQGPSPLGDEFQVNSYTLGSQVQPAVAADQEGNFVVVWESSDGDGEGVFGRIFAASGEPMGREFRVNSHTASYQVAPAAAADPAGNFVVVWSSSFQDGSDYGIFGQRYDTKGEPLGGEFRANTHTTGSQTSPTVATDASGAFVVAWSGAEQDGSSYGVFARRYDADGNPLGAEFQVNTYTTSFQGIPHVASAAAGEFLVTWASADQGGAFAEVFGQRYDDAGRPVAGEFQVNTYTTDNQTSPAAALGPAGEFVVVWSSFLQDGYGFGVFGQRFDPDGNPAGDEFQVNTFTNFFQGLGGARITADAAGSFVVAWDSQGQDGSGYGVFGQRYDASGGSVGGEFRINTNTVNAQSAPGVAAQANGDFVVVWHSFGQDGSLWGVFGQRFSGSIFADGFESGDVSAWDQTVR